MAFESVISEIVIFVKVWFSSVFGGRFWYLRNSFLDKSGHNLKIDKHESENWYDICKNGVSNSEYDEFSFDKWYKSIEVEKFR